MKENRIMEQTIIIERQQKGSKKVDDLQVVFFFAFSRGKQNYGIFLYNKHLRFQFYNSGRCHNMCIYIYMCTTIIYLDVYIE